MGIVNRRRFLLVSAVGSGAFAFGATICGVRACNDARRGASDPRDGPAPITKAGRAFGTKVSITVIDGREDVARRAAAEALAEVETVDRLMSPYRPESEVCRLNRAGTLTKPHPYLRSILRSATQMSRRSGGAFDVTVQPLWAVFADAQKIGGLPDDTALDAAAAKVGWRQVQLLADEVRLGGKGAAVTLNGIAQGFAADRATAVLRRFGIGHALIDTGEIGAVGDKRAGGPWTVGIQHPRRPDAYINLAALAGRSLATSGDYATTFSPDYRAHHLFDPRTGRSANTFSSVSVSASSATVADALSTAVFVLGVGRGLELVRATPGADAFVVLKDGRSLATAGFPLADSVDRPA
jgi:thiamine biosynthesis lipoprotein